MHRIRIWDGLARGMSPEQAETVRVELERGGDAEKAWTAVEVRNLAHRMDAVVAAFLALAHVRDDVAVDLTEHWAGLARVGSGIVAIESPATQPSLDSSTLAGDDTLPSAGTPVVAERVPAPPAAEVAPPSQSPAHEPPRPNANVDARPRVASPGVARAQAGSRPRGPAKPRLFVVDEGPVRREQVLLRAGFCGPAGSGKSLTALMLAARMVETMGIGPLWVIDTEHGSSKNYAYSPSTGGGYTFHRVRLESDFSPAAYIAALEYCEDHGAGVVVIDSLSHAWNGMNGILELVDQKTEPARGKGPVSSGWKEMSGVQTRFVERVLQSSAHILFTARAKMEWATDRAGEGKLEGRRVGLAPVQKDGLEYEPDFFFDMTSDHRLILSKSRVYDWPGLENGAVFARPGKEFADLVIAWAQDGAPRVDELADALAAAVAASVDRPSYDDARKGLGAWMAEHGIAKMKAEATLAAFNRRVRIARGAAA